MNRAVPRGRLATLVLGIALAVAVPTHAEPPAAAPLPRLGWSVEASAATLPSIDAAPSNAAPVWRRVEVRWELIEGPNGDSDWRAVDAAVVAAVTAGDPLCLVLTGRHPRYLDPGEIPSPLRAPSLERWLSFSRSVVRRFAGRVGHFEIAPGDATDGSPAGDAAAYAFLLKNTALALRAEAAAAGTSIAVAQAAIRPEQLAWQRELWAADVAPYVDIVPVVLGPQLSDASRGELAALLAETRANPPAPRVWARIRPGDEPAARAAALEALSIGADVALLDLGDVASPAVRWIRGIQNLLTPGYAPAPERPTAFHDAQDRPLGEGRVLARFFSDEDFSTLLFYELPGTPDVPRERLIVDNARATDLELFDPVTGESLRLGSAPVPGGRAIRIRRGPYPLALRFRQGSASPGFEIPSEQIETLQTRELTAEEIIARHQEVRQAQDDGLERWTALGRLDLHFKLARGGGTIDFSIDSRYFWERGRALEWEETGYYINGNKVRWKRVPDLPLIQPEKVITLPLDLTLDRTYLYRLLGRERVGGREAYALEFQPAAAQGPVSLYAGRIWIDAQRFVLLKASLVQNGLDVPVLSNEEDDRYVPVSGPQGREFWMLGQVDGQQVWSTGGRNFIVRRELVFSDFRINPPEEDFRTQRDQAYASSHKMMRDTEQGARYLQREDDGTRTVKADVQRSYFFGGLGAFKDSSTDGVTPLLGVNYFNYGVRGGDLQFNAFFAGVFGFFTLSKPDFAGAKRDGTIDLGLQGLAFDDKVFRGDREVLAERIESRDQTIGFRLGLPAGDFVKFEGTINLRQVAFSTDEEARDAIDALNAANPPAQVAFRLPADHWEYGGTLSFEFNRRGWTVSGNGSWARRDAWRPWGLFDVATGTPLSCDSLSGACAPRPAEALPDQHLLWGLTAFKEWYLPKFQKLRAEIDYVDGSDLDRFSRHRFSFFGRDRLNGFSGSGVRFDRGAIARAGYAFNLFEAIRFDAALEKAWVEEAGNPAGRQSFSGVGLSGNVVGPWQTVISLNYGYALDSDIPELEGEQEFLLLVLKLF